MSISFTFYDHSTTDQVLFASSEFFFFFFIHLFNRERESACRVLWCGQRERERSRFLAENKTYRGEAFRGIGGLARQKAGFELGTSRQ